MSVFTTLQIAHCMQTLLHSAHTRIFARWFTTGAASITSHSPLTLYDLWVRKEQVLVCRCYTFISTFYTMYLTTGRQQRMDIYTTVSETRWSASHSMPARAAWPVAADLSSYLLCPADLWPPTIQHDLSILAECQGHCPVMWGHVHQRLWLWCYVEVFSYAKNQDTKAILL